MQAFFSRRGLPRLLPALVALLCVAAAPQARAGASFVMEAGSGKVLHQHLSDQTWAPASLTKLMTTYLALAALRDGRLSLDSPVVMSKNANDQPFNTMTYAQGHRISLDTALKLMLVKSANDVAVAVAETVAGSEDAFVAAMNAEAAALGMAHTRFQNPNGIHAREHYSTAHDLAVLAVALRRDFPQYAPLFALPSVTVDGQTMKNYNPLLGTIAGADGMKTGYVCESGYNLVGSATRDGRTVIAVVLGAASEAERAKIATALMEAALAGEIDAGDGERRAQPEPVDMRPYVCAGKTLPTALSGF